MKLRRQFEIEDVEQLLETVAYWAAGYDHFAVFVTDRRNFRCAVGAAQYIEITETSGALSKLEAFHAAASGRIVGYMGYDLKNDVEQLTSANPDCLGMPEAAFFLPEMWISCTDGLVILESSAENILNDALDTLRYPSPFTPRKAPSIALVASESRDSYIKGVQSLQQHLHHGDIYEANFCMQFHGQAVGLSPLHRFIKLQSLTEAPFSVFARFEDHYIMCASPERFLKRKGTLLTSQPIKGTIRRSDNPTVDNELKEQLSKDPKEQSENVMIVDLVRNDLSRVAAPDSVKVAELYGIHTFKTVHHMISTVEATLLEGQSSWDAIRACFPMGSMTGAPKVSAMKLIEAHEHFKRGAYSGAFGWMEPNGDFDFNVMIRSLFFNSATQTIAFSVGSAITVQAHAEKEYEECLLKAAALLQSLDIDTLP